MHWGLVIAGGMNTTGHPTFSVTSTGGSTGVRFSTVTYLPPFYAARGHCAVVLDRETLLLAGGGYNDHDAISRVVLYDSVSK